jgi:hypothetical protein
MNGGNCYLPYGLDVVENLANKVLPELTRRLDLEITSVSVDRQPFAHLVGDTEVGRLIAGLSERTDPEKIRTLATLSESETKRIAEISIALAEAEAGTFNFFRSCSQRKQQNPFSSLLRTVFLVR